ncbi:hypothetical protein Ciccas_002207 [Cichlidogyrus casuarinus]|uniref:Uncharacterized protein n=1 Tax=Cichlidogyrus casuarinus TaxID=1844966 RepID=A0ABD2QHX9_9PLAT
MFIIQLFSSAKVIKHVGGVFYVERQFTFTSWPGRDNQTCLQISCMIDQDEYVSDEIVLKNRTVCRHTLCLSWSSLLAGMAGIILVNLLVFAGIYLAYARQSCKKHPTQNAISSPRERCLLPKTESDLEVYNHQSTLDNVFIPPSNSFLTLH